MSPTATNEHHEPQPASAVLVVDDSPEVLRSLGRAILATGHPVVSTTDSATALRCLADPESSVGIAIVDLFIGEEDGLDLLARLAADHPRVRRVLMSGQVRGCQLDLALSRGLAHAVLSKPWDRQQLIRAAEL